MTVKAFETPNLGVLITEVTEETDTTWFLKNPKFLQMIPQRTEEGREVLNPILPPVIYNEILSNSEHTTFIEKDSAYKDITEQIRIELLDLYKQYEGSQVVEEPQADNVVDLFGIEEEGGGECCGGGCCGDEN